MVIFRLKRKWLSSWVVIIIDVKGSITMVAANIVKYSCMNSKDVCVNNLTAEEQARNTYDRLNEIRSYGFEVEDAQ